MRARSPKRAVADAADRVLRDEFMAAHPRCEYPGCSSPSHDRHHMHTRNTRPDLIHDPRYWRALCRACHRRVTEYPAEAVELGLSLRSWDTP